MKTSCHGHRHSEEHHDFAQTGNQVADHLGEADDVDTDPVVLEHTDLLFKIVGKGAIVQRLAGLGIHIEHRRDDHAGAQIL